jgi:superoxide dismutase, Fe-Mn family
MGSGWTALVSEPVGRRLLTTQIDDHQSNRSQGGITLLVLDAWKHALHLQYQNRKAEFCEAVWNAWNWTDAAARFRAVKDMDVKLPGTSRH